MNRTVFLFVIFIAFPTRYVTCHDGINTDASITINLYKQDTVQKRQILYNGTLWANRYHRIKNHQFLFSDLFLTGSISINGKTFDKVRIKYDIYLDEIITPVNSRDILQLNKEMVDSFTISFEDKVYRFTNIRNDTLKGSGIYANMLYKGNVSFYVRYKKSISPYSSPQSDGNFIQNHSLYLMKDNRVYMINKTRTLFRILNADKGQIKNFIKNSRLRISKKRPESFVPVIRYYDGLTQ